MQQLSSYFLSEIMKNIRSNRAKLPEEMLYFNRIETGLNGEIANIWFMTQGCKWDQSGGCTMCNYGNGHRVSNETMIEAVRNAFNEITVPLTEVFVSPSGSMFDTEEVPIPVRNEIYHLLASQDFDYFACETRAETIDKKTISELTEKLPSKRWGIEMGWESADDWKRHYCVNKGTTKEQYLNAIEILSRAGVESLVNISVGTAFLSPKEAIEDAEASVKWALDHGTDTVVLFPLHIKPNTLLAYLNQIGEYKQVSLWALIEVLDRIGSEARKNTDISWYRNGYGDDKKVISSPVTCPKCQEQVLNLLDTYRATRSEEDFNRIKYMRCQCRTEWEKNIELPRELPLYKRVYETYKILAHDFNMDGWWKCNHEELYIEMKQNYERN